MNCPRCGAPTNPGVAFCPNCGTALTANQQPPARQSYVPPPPKSSVPLALVIIAIVLLTIVLAASTVMNRSAATEDTSGSYTADRVAWDYSLRHYANFTDTNDYLTEPSAGNEYVLVTIRLVNNASVSVSTNSLYWDYTVDNITYGSSFETYSDDIANYTLVTLNTGGSATYQIVYEVPSGLGDGVLSYSGPHSSYFVRDRSLL